MKRTPKFHNNEQEYAWYRSQGHKIKSRKGRQENLRFLKALKKFDVIFLKRLRRK